MVNFKSTDILCQNIHRYISDISDISVKSKYRYIRNYRYFHPCLRHAKPRHKHIPCKCFILQAIISKALSFSLALHGHPNNSSGCRFIFWYFFFLPLARNNLRHSNAHHKIVPSIQTPQDAGSFLVFLFSFCFQWGTTWDIKIFAIYAWRISHLFSAQFSEFLFS